MTEPAPIDMTSVGGIITVILSKDMPLPEPYDTNPQVFPLLGSDLPQMRDELSAKIPSNTKVVLIGGEIPSGVFGVLRRVLDARNLKYVARANPTALGAALRLVLSKDPEAPPPALTTSIQIAAKALDDLNKPSSQLKLAPPPQIRGSVSSLIAEADLSKGSSEEARRLFRLAQQRGITTTINSLTSGISNAKRKHGRSETPMSLMSPQQVVLKTMDDAIAGFTLVREYVEGAEKRIADMEAKIERLQSVFRSYQDVMQA